MTWPTLVLDQSYEGWLLTNYWPLLRKFSKFTPLRTIFIQFHDQIWQLSWSIVSASTSVLTAKQYERSLEVNNGAHPYCVNIWNPSSICPNTFIRPEHVDVIARFLTCFRNMASNTDYSFYTRCGSKYPLKLSTFRWGNPYQTVIVSTI